MILEPHPISMDIYMSPRSSLSLLHGAALFKKIISCPRLTAAHVTKYLDKSMATTMGHLDQKRKIPDRQNASPPHLSHKQWRTFTQPRANMQCNIVADRKNQMHNMQWTNWLFPLNLQQRKQICYDHVLCRYNHHPIPTHEKYTRNRNGNRLHNSTTKNVQARFQIEATSFRQQSHKLPENFCDQGG